MALSIPRNKGLGSHQGVYSPASAASWGGQRLRLNSIPASGLELSLKVGFGEGGQHRKTWPPVLIFQGRGVLFLLWIISFHFNLTLHVKEILHEARTRSSGMISSTSPPLSCFLCPLQQRPSAQWPSWQFIWLNLCSWLPVHVKCAFFLFILHQSVNGIKARAEPPQPVYISEHWAVGFEVLDILGDVST